MCLSIRIVAVGPAAPSTDAIAVAVRIGARQARVACSVAGLEPRVRSAIDHAVAVVVGAVAADLCARRRLTHAWAPHAVEALLTSDATHAHAPRRSWSRVALAQHAVVAASFGRCVGHHGGFLGSVWGRPVSARIRK